MNNKFRKLIEFEVNLEYSGDYKNDCKKLEWLKISAYILTSIILIVNVIAYLNTRDIKQEAVKNTKVISSQQYKTSFNCKKATTYVEQTICSDSELAKLDIKLAKTYNDKLKSTTSKTKLRQEQKNWVLNIENQCTTKDCISQVILRRIEELSDNTMSEAIYLMVINSKLNVKEQVLTLKILSNHFSALGCALGPGGADEGTCDYYSEQNSKQRILKDISTWQFPDSEYSLCNETAEQILNKINDEKISSAGGRVTFCELEVAAKNLAKQNKIANGINFYNSSCF